MADQHNIRINVSATNNSGLTFQQIRTDLDKLKIELTRPIDGPNLRGLIRRGDAGEAAARARVSGPGGGLTAGDLSHEANERFRATARNLADANRNIAAAGDGFGLIVRGAVLMKAAEALGNVGKAIADFKTSVSLGENRVSAFAKSAFDAIPIVGQFAESGRKIREVLDRLINPAEELRKDLLEQAQDARDERVKVRDRANAKHAAINSQAGAALYQSQKDLFLTGQQGAGAERSQALLALRESLAKAGSLRGQAGGLSTTADQDRIRKEADELEVNAKKVYGAKLKEIQDHLNDEESQRMRDHLNDVAAMRESVNELNLQSEGKATEARVAAIKFSGDKELAALKEKRDAEQEALVKQGIMPTDAMWQAAQQRFTESAAALAEKTAAEATAAWQAQFRDDWDSLSRELAGMKPSGSSGVRGRSPFSGESRLLTGVGSTTDPLLAPTKETAKLSQEGVGHLARIVELLMTGGTPVAGPA